MATTHTCEPGHPGVLADGCDRCAEHAKEPMLLSLDQEKMQRLWAEMIAVEHGSGTPEYVTAADAEAGKQLYRIAVWLERYAEIDPWRPLGTFWKDPV